MEIDVERIRDLATRIIELSKDYNASEFIVAIDLVMASVHATYNLEEKNEKAIRMLTRGMVELKNEMGDEDAR